MTPLEDMLLELCDGVNQQIPDEAIALGVQIDELLVELPVELQVYPEIRVSAPRGKLATGFDSRLTRLKAVFVRREGT